MHLQAKEVCLEKGLLIPDIATIKEDCLGRGVAAADTDVIKDFCAFLYYY